MKVLAVDAGNTRVKWGWHDGSAWANQSAVDTARAEQLGGVWAALPEPDAVVVSNVAGEERGATLAGALKRFRVTPRWIASVRSQCGVTNGYDDPDQLGCDRWAALIGAWRRCGGPSLVVTAGTALTVDALTAEGVFIGGLIVPGARLMKRSLAAHTAGLALAAGRYAGFPANTADAIASGAIEALCGAVERAVRRLRELSAAEPRCVLSGGAAHELAPRLNLPFELVDNLALEGLLAIAQEARPQ